MSRKTGIDRPTEYKTFVGELKANDAQYEMEGYLNAIGNIDDGDDRTMPGAFKRTINAAYQVKKAESNDYLWPYLWNHDYNILPPGGIYDADEDKQGLFIKVRFNPDIQLGRETYASFKAGMLKKQSMGYKTIRHEYVKDGSKSIRNLLEVQILEGSAVVFPMNNLANVTGVKRHMNKQQRPQTKDFNATYQQRLQSDWLDDLWNLWFSLRSEIMTAFQTGDTPVEDVRTALSQFTDAMLAYTQQGVDLGMVEALQPDDDDDSYSYGYMSADLLHELKEGRMLSATNHATMTKAVQGLEQHTKTLKTFLQSAKPADKSDSLFQAALGTKGQEDDPALSTHLDDLLASVQLTNIRQSLKK